MYGSKRINNNIMRDLIVARLEELKEKGNGFSRDTMRWKNIFFVINSKPKHLSEVEWCELDDIELLFLYERVIRQYYKSM